MATAQPPFANNLISFVIMRSSHSISWSRINFILSS